MDKQASVIIPARNEAQTIGEVIRVAKSSHLVSEVLVVSDGSTDETVSIAQSMGARVINLPENLGKGNAIQTGVSQTTSDVLLFLDADLIGLTAHHLEQLILPVMNGRVAMNVGMRDRGTWITALQHHLFLISGERALRRVVFDRISPKFIQGFRLEPALNYSCKAQRFSTGIVDMRGLHIRHKYQKVGLFTSVVQYLRMTYQIILAMISVRFAHVFGTFLT